MNPIVLINGAKAEEAEACSKVLKARYPNVEVEAQNGNLANILRNFQGRLGGIIHFCEDPKDIPLTLLWWMGHYPLSPDTPQVHKSNRSPIWAFYRRGELEVESKVRSVAFDSANVVTHRLPCGIPLNDAFSDFIHQTMGRPARTLLDSTHILLGADLHTTLPNGDRKRIPAGKEICLEACDVDRTAVLPAFRGRNIVSQDSNLKMKDGGPITIPKGARLIKEGNGWRIIPNQDAVERSFISPDQLVVCRGRNLSQGDLESAGSLEYYSDLHPRDIPAWQQMMREYSAHLSSRA